MALKVLHVLDHSLPLHSGYAFRSQDIFLSQVKRGWQPVIVTSPKHQESWKNQDTLKDKIDGLPYYRTLKLSGGSFPCEYEIRLMKALSKRIHEVVRTEKPDILHAHSPILNAIPSLWVGHKTGIPVIYEIRAFWEDAAVDHGTYVQRSWKYKLIKYLETMVCKKVDQVVVICNGLKNDLEKRGIPSVKTSIVYNGINASDFKKCNPDADYMKEWNLNGKKVIGFIGSFYKYEGLDFLVKAFRQLASRRKDVVLLLVGGGEVEAELRRQIRKLFIEKKVIMPGRIPHDRIPGIYAFFDVLVYPRYSMRLTELVTPLKPLEAMAMGKAVVASDIGGHREIIQHQETGYLFPIDNVDALASAIEQLLNNSELRQRLQKQGIAWVHKNRTWDKTTSVYETIYYKVMENKL